MSPTNTDYFRPSFGIYWEFFGIFCIIALIWPLLGFYLTFIFGIFRYFRLNLAFIGIYLTFILHFWHIFGIFWHLFGIIGIYIPRCWTISKRINSLSFQAELEQCIDSIGLSLPPNEAFLCKAKGKAAAKCCKAEVQVPILPKVTNIWLHIY
jgi:hypothetical protein